MGSKHPKPDGFTAPPCAKRPESAGRSAGETEKSLHVLSKEPPTLADFLNDDLQKESQIDRSVAITSSSWVEDALESTIKSRLRPLNSTELDQLFSFDRPLGNFGSKIRFAYALGLYDKGIRNSLEIIREIRNAFAHGRKFITFNDEQIIKKTSKLKIPESIKFMTIGMLSYGGWPPVKSIDRYTATCHIVTIYLSKERDRKDFNLLNPLPLE